MEDRQKIIEKLVKIKALAERGIGGEQQTAQVMYATLKEKYKVTDAEIEKAAAVPVDISEIDLKKFWGIAFQLAAVAKTLQEETDICTACPYTYTDEQCTGCGTYWNMRDLRIDFEAIQQRLIKAATEGQGMAARKAKKPKHQKSEYPTLPGKLGYLNSYYCPVCGKHLFSAYDKDLRKDREDGYYFRVSRDFNYCSKCGTLLDLDEWKREEEPAAAGEELTLED